MARTKAGLCVFAVAIAVLYCCGFVASDSLMVEDEQPLTAAAASDQIINLPGLAKQPTFKQYAGYITVDEARGRRLFYWFTESQSRPANDPLVLWLNGGPGCSSLGGLFTELGPFIPNAEDKGKTLKENPFSYNKVANVIFLESPAGVGFSYSDTPSDYTVGDVRTANDSYTFLLKFMAQYPQFANHEFWVTGESYGGHYVPELTQRIVAGNKANNAPKINLKGFMVGNAWTDAPLDNLGAAYDWVTHALISERTYLAINATCNFSDIGPMKANNADGAVDPVKCSEYQQQASSEMGNINIYQIYSDVCLSNQQRDGHALLYHLATSDSPFSTMAKELFNKLSAPSANSELGWYPCSSDYLANYLNEPEVQTAIHAHKLPYQWSDCSPRVHYSRTDLLTSVLPVYRDLMQDPTLRLLVYSGDVDGIVPVTGTRMWLAALNLKEKATWRPWTASNKQVGGYITKYEPNLTFITVRGAGHLVPGTQPLRAFDMFSRFLKNQF